MSQPSRMPSLIPESAPFTAEQRVWLNGLFAGLLSLENGVTPLSPEQAAALLPGGLGLAAPTSTEESRTLGARESGLDMFMVPDDWQALYRNTLQQVKSGEISQQRLDEAVARVLRVKMRAGVLDAPKPSERKNAGNWALLASPEHRAIAREAVRESLVLLKNEASLLPLHFVLEIVGAVTGDKHRGICVEGQQRGFIFQQHQGFSDGFTGNSPVFR